MFLSKNKYLGFFSFIRFVYISSRIFNDIYNIILLILFFIIRKFKNFIVFMIVYIFEVKRDIE